MILYLYEKKIKNLEKKRFFLEKFFQSNNYQEMFKGSRNLSGVTLTQPVLFNDENKCGTKLENSQKHETSVVQFFVLAKIYLKTNVF